MPLHPPTIGHNYDHDHDRSSRSRNSQTAGSRSSVETARSNKAEEETHHHAHAHAHLPPVSPSILAATTSRHKSKHKLKPRPRSRSRESGTAVVQETKTKTRKVFGTWIRARGGGDDAPVLVGEEERRAASLDEDHRHHHQELTKDARRLSDPLRWDGNAQVPVLLDNIAMSSQKQQHEEEVGQKTCDAGGGWSRDHRQHDQHNQNQSLSSSHQKYTPHLPSPPSQHLALRTRNLGSSSSSSTNVNFSYPSGASSPMTKATAESRSGGEGEGGQQSNDNDDDGGDDEANNGTITIAMYASPSTARPGGGATSPSSVYDDPKVSPGQDTLAWWRQKTGEVQSPPCALAKSGCTSGKIPRPPDQFCEDCNFRPRESMFEPLTDRNRVSGVGAAARLQEQQQEVRQSEADMPATKIASKFNPTLSAKSYEKFRLDPAPRGTASSNKHDSTTSTGSDKSHVGFQMAGPKTPEPGHWRQSDAQAQAQLDEYPDYGSATSDDWESRSYEDDSPPLSGTDSASLRYSQDRKRTSDATSIDSKAYDMMSAVGDDGGDAIDGVGNRNAYNGVSEVFDIYHELQQLDEVRIEREKPIVSETAGSADKPSKRREDGKINITTSQREVPKRSKMATKSRGGARGSRDRKDAKKVWSQGDDRDEDKPPEGNWI